MNLKFTIVFLLFAAMGLGFFHMLKSSDELKSKREWSLMQIIQENKKGTNYSSRVVVERVEECTAVGILPANSNKRVWIMLNPKYQPWIKVIPNEDFYISPSELELLKLETEMDEKVLNYLQTRVKRLDDI